MALLETVLGATLGGAAAAGTGAGIGAASSPKAKVPLPNKWQIIVSALSAIPDIIMSWQTMLETEELRDQFRYRMEPGRWLYG
jgi:hypothetical protein